MLLHHVGCCLTPTLSFSYQRLAEGGQRKTFSPVSFCKRQQSSGRRESHLSQSWTSGPLAFQFNNHGPPRPLPPRLSFQSLCCFAGCRQGVERSLFCVPRNRSPAVAWESSSLLTPTGSTSPTGIRQVLLWRELGCFLMLFVTLNCLYSTT